MLLPGFNLLRLVRVLRIVRYNFPSTTRKLLVLRTGSGTKSPDFPLARVSAFDCQRAHCQVLPSGEINELKPPCQYSLYRERGRWDLISRALSIGADLVRCHHHPSVRSFGTGIRAATVFVRDDWYEDKVYYGMFGTETRSRSIIL
eukprot:2098609-Rhodomonas_salina.1